MNRSIHRSKRQGVAWLELLLVLALLALLVQLVPAVGTWLKGLLLWLYAVNQWWFPYLDIRNYSWPAWGVLNFFLAAALIAFRSRIGLRSWLSKRRETMKTAAEKRAQDKAKEREQRELQEQRETIQRIIDSRSRRNL